MKKRNIILVVAGGIILSISSFTVLRGKFDKSANGSKTAYTNSPHDGAGDCTNCHSGGSAIPVVTLTASPAFGPGNTYTPGTTYTLSYNVTGYPKFGFDIELNDGNTTSSMGAGTNVAVSNCKVTANPYSLGYPANVSHNAVLSSSTSATWHWTAPTNGATVYVYSVGVGANGNNSDSGDRMTQYNLVLTPASTTGIKPEENMLSELTIFPNPTADNVHLSYTLSKRSDVVIEVFDIKGQMVQTLINGSQDAGMQTIDKTISLSKGMYNVSLSVNGQKSFKKLIVQ